MIRIRPPYEEEGDVSEQIMEPGQEDEPRGSNKNTTKIAPEQFALHLGCDVADTMLIPRTDYSAFTWPTTPIPTYLPQQNFIKRG